MSSGLRGYRRAVDRRRLLDVLLMEWGGDRNLALRDALGLQEGEVGFVDMSQTVQTRLDTEKRADEIRQKLRAGLPSLEVSKVQRRDGRWVVLAWKG